MKEKRISRLRLSRKAFRVEELVLVVIFTLIGIGGVFLANYAVTAYQYEIAQKGYYSENARGIYARADDKRSFDGGVYTFFAAHEDFSLYHYLSPHHFGLLTNGETFEPDMVEGRFFTESDFYAGRRLCVMGQNYTIGVGTANEQITEADGKRFLRYYGEQYEIIGVMGYSVASDVDRAVYFNLDALETDMNGAYQVFPFIVDGLSARQTRLLTDDLSALITAAGGTPVEVNLPVQNMSLGEFFRVNFLNAIMIIFAVFSVVLATVPVTLYWSQRRRRAAAVRRMLGFGTPHIVLMMFGRLLLLFHGGYLLGFGLYNAAARIWYWGLRSPFSTEGIAAYLAALITALLIAVVPFVQTMRIDPGDALRRE